MASVMVELQISADELLKYYQGMAKQVSARAADGRWIAFPVNILQPYVTHTGIQGKFSIHYDDQGRFQSINKVADV